MRSIGLIAEEASARAFSDYLYVQGIENQLDHEGPAGWSIWIRDEDRLAAAAEALAAFRTNPAEARFQKGASGATAEKLRKKAEEDQAAYEKRLKSRRNLFRPLSPYAFGPLTFTLIAICVGVAILSNRGENRQAIMGLFITDFVIDDGRITFMRNLPEIRHLQLWRLITPIFIHFGIMHIVFNMLWLRDLGSMVEGRQSALYLGVFTLVIAMASNLAQFFVSGSPSFGGMSGVVYGLIGYIWIRGKRDPGSGLYLHSSTVTMAMIWFFLCYTPFIPNVANTAHATGLVLGMVWGFISSSRHR